MAVQDNNHLTPSEFESKNPIIYFKSSLKLLIRSEKSLSFMFLINFFCSFQYYILVTLIPLYFTSEHGYSDFQSGLTFGIFGIMIGIYSIFFTSIIHKINPKKGLIISSFLGILGFFMMMAHNNHFSLAAIFLFEAVSCSLSWPFIEFAINEYSIHEVRSLSSSCFFISNYLAGIVAGLVIDNCWYFIQDKNFAYSILFFFPVLGLLLNGVLVYACRKIENHDKNEVLNKKLEKSQFLRFCLLIFLLILLRSAVFGHLDATLPKYILKTYDKKAHFGVLLMIHSLTMLLGIFSFTALTYVYSSYSLITIGAFVGGLGSIFLIISSNFLFTIFFVVAISAGESI